MLVRLMLRKLSAPSELSLSSRRFCYTFAENILHSATLIEETYKCTVAKSTLTVFSSLTSQIHLGVYYYNVKVQVTEMVIHFDADGTIQLL